MTVTQNGKEVATLIAKTTVDRNNKTITLPPVPLNLSPKDLSEIRMTRSCTQNLIHLGSPKSAGTLKLKYGDLEESKNNLGIQLFRDDFFSRPREEISNVILMN